MTDKTNTNYLLVFPKPVAYEYTVMNQDATTKTYLPTRVKTLATAVWGLNEAFKHTEAIQRAGSDIFDIVDFRKTLKESLDYKNRREFDDEFLVVTDSQLNMIRAAVRATNWDFPRPLGDNLVETTTIWIDWVEFFNAFRNPKALNIGEIDEAYAQWSIDKRKRLAAEAEAETTADAKPTAEVA